ncbi:hypothetical protein HYT25_00170 [Candidatus Pacearchaeota archaeon]|nr:hypothetical protein [Candidatus Pacearchaeota archaeon]
MTRMKIEDITFWIIIILIIALAIWLLLGSPTDTSAIVALAVFVAASEILIWKSLFSIDKKTAIGFEKIKNSIENLRKDLNKNN